MKRQRFSLLGIRLDMTDYDAACAMIMDWIRTDKREYACFVNVYAAMEYQKDSALLAWVNRAGLVAPDGMPLVWVSRLYRLKPSRVYGTTLVRKLFRVSGNRKLSVFFLGSQPGQGKRLLRKMKSEHPQIDVKSVYETPVRPLTERMNADIVRRINAVQPDIVLVGLGCPHQERWIARHRARIRAPVLMGVGSTVDFLSGDKREAPEWIQAAGFEWLFRFLQEPRRLWYRYTVVSAKFLWLIAGQMLRDALRPPEGSSA